MIDEEHPVIAVVPEGVGATAMLPVLERLQARHVDLVVLGGPTATAYATSGVLLDHGLPEDLAPIADIIALQQLALVMATSRGFDPDNPRGLSKVTETW
jgi:glucosamine--fructose-6-phosphate aminotransferase (isomerizing)